MNLLMYIGMVANFRKATRHPNLRLVYRSQNGEQRIEREFRWLVDFAV
jgi:hypothetical protein